MLVPDNVMDVASICTQKKRKKRIGGKRREDNTYMASKKQGEGKRGGAEWSTNTNRLG